MRELVDKKKLEKALNTLVNSGCISDGAYNYIWNKIKGCLLSPAELGGDSWVLEELKAKLRDGLKTPVTGERSDLFVYYKNALNDTLADIRDLEFQTPAELANLPAKDRQAGEIEEDRRKVKEYDAMQKRIKESVRKMREFQEQLDKDIKITRKDLEEEFTEFLAQSEIPHKFKAKDKLLILVVKLKEEK